MQLDILAALLEHFRQSYAMKKSYEVLKFKIWAKFVCEKVPF